MSYMTVNEIRELSRRNPDIINATKEEIEFWMAEAEDLIHTFCQQDFKLELQTTKQARAGTSTLVYLPKPLSGDITVTTSSGQVIYNGSATNLASTNYVSQNMLNNNMVEIFPGKPFIGYYIGNSPTPSPKTDALMITGDWGFYTNNTSYLVSFVNSIKDCYESHRQNTVVHPAVDTLNAVTLSATTLDEAILLANELKGVINSHLGDIVVHSAADVDIIVASDASDESTLYTLVTETKVKLNRHLTRTLESDPKVHIEEDITSKCFTNSDMDSCVLPRQIKRAFLRIVQRIAIRANHEDTRQENSAYANETLGDNYSYDLSNGTLRNLIRPEEAHMLNPYVNRGHIVI